MRLERLVLSNIRNFRGTMPPEINLLSPTEISITHMTSQSFAMEDLLQTDKATMARLKKLDFSHTRLHGSIADDIGWMKFLEEIHFSHCSFLEGTLPTQLGLFDNLRILSVQGNELTGPIPEAIISLRKLEHVELQSNALTGHIPDGWCSMTSLVKLHLDDNYLEGAIPHCMTTLPSMVAFTYEGTNLIAP
jgi:Leucine rich repeat